MLSSISYLLLEKAIVRCNGDDSILARAVGGNDRKSVISLAIYLVAIPMAYYRPPVAIALYLVNALLWFAPDRRIEKLV